MAFATGRSSESSSFKRYIGVGSFKCIAVNPTAAELSNIYNGREITTEPVYTGTAVVKNKDNNDTEVQTATLQIYIQSDPDKNNGIDTIFHTRITIFNAPWYSFNGDVVKAQVIDEYGRTAWATLDEIKAKQIPVYRNGKPANISANYRMAFRGEAELTDFIINFLNIPNVQTYNKETKTWSLVADPKKSEARFEVETLKSFFKGKFGDIADLIKYQPENHIKIAVGVRTSEDGKMYQDVYTRKTLRNGAKNNDPIQADIEAAKAAGSLKSTDFFIIDVNNHLILPTLQEYDSQPTTFATTTMEAMPEDDGMNETSDLSDLDDLPFGN